MPVRSGFEIPSWDQVYSVLLEVADRIRTDGFTPEMIIAVSRGGGIPARILSDLLETPVGGEVQVAYYVGIGATKQEPEITAGVSAPVRGRVVLVVDDVCDSGESLRVVQAHLAAQGVRELRSAVAYVKPRSIRKPDYYGRRTEQWVVFPWEWRETVRDLAEAYQEDGRSRNEAKEALVQSGLDRAVAERFFTDGGSA